MYKNKRFFWYLIPYVLGASLFSLALSSWYVFKAMRDEVIALAARDLAIRANLMADQFGQALADQDYRLVDQLAKGADRLANARITIILPDGRVVGDSRATPSTMENHADRPEIATALSGQNGQATRYSRTLAQNMIYVATPLGSGAEMLGVIRLAWSVTTFDRKFAPIKIRLALGTMAVAMLSALLCFWLSRRISRPLEALKSGAEQFARGELGPKLSPPGITELNDLALTLNDMAVKLQARIETIGRQRNQIEAVLTSMTEGVVAIDGSETVIISNRVASELLGHASGDIVGMKLHEVIRNAQFQRFYAQALSSGSVQSGIITLYEDPERILRLTSAPLKESAGEQLGTLFVLRDVTQIKQLEKIRTDFAANVSHEIKTPLTSIKGFIETLLDMQGQSDDTSRFLHIVAKNVQRLEDIVEDLMRIAQLEARQKEGDQQEITLEEHRLSEVIQKAVSHCQPTALKSGINLDWQCPTALTARLNPSLFEQALVNLIDNAIHYSPSGKTAQVDARETGKGIEIAVRDQGVGITPRHQARIFERFYRVDESRSRATGGTGLGLAIVKHIINLHGGRITLESAPGRGSTFTIWLPELNPQPV